MMGRRKAIILAVLAIAGLGAAYTMGLFTADDANRLGRDIYYKGKGTVGQAVGTLGSVGRSGSGDPNKAAECRGNLERIESAKRAVANELAIPSGDVPENRVLAALGGSLPVCPDGGRYKINAVGFTPTCSIGVGDPSDPLDDHVLNNF